MGQVAAHLARNPADGIRLLMDPVLKAVLAKEAEKDPQVQAALACLSGGRMLSPIEAIAFMFQAHMSRNGYHMAHMTVPSVLPPRSHLDRELKQISPQLWPIF
jgi:hypothetical protein